MEELSEALPRLSGNGACVGCRRGFRDIFLGRSCRRLGSVAPLLLANATFHSYVGVVPGMYLVQVHNITRSRKTWPLNFLVGLANSIFFSSRAGRYMHSMAERRGRT